MTRFPSAGFGLLAVLAPLLVSPGLRADPPAFRAGFAERDVSPSVGMEQPGGYGKAVHRAFHDPCKARAAVFDDGARRVAIVGLDALFIRGRTVRSVREAIRKACGIEPGSILIAASHTHSGGPIGYTLPGELDGDGTPPLVRSLAYDRSVVADAKYLEKVEAGIVEAVKEADSRLAPARAAAGFGVEDRVAFNRRFRMKQGHAMTHPGQGNPDIIEPAGPTDPQVGVIGCWDPDGKLKGCVVNFACHCTTGPPGISADYVAYVEKAVRGVFGEHAVVVFVPGAAGDVTQVDNRAPRKIAQFGEVSARFVGGRVGAEAVKVLLAMEQSAGPLSPVAAAGKVLKIERRKPSPAHLAEAMALVRKDPEDADATDWTFAKETVVLAARIAREPVADVEVQAVQVGPAVLLACPAEYFCAFGLELKARSKFPFTFPVSLANDCVGYVPTEEALTPGPLGGGYETRLTSYSNLAPDAGRRMADALIELSAALRPGAAPEPPTLPPFAGRPWAYGSLPPQRD
ncbi:Neutral ceramidase precursor [Aquisphaera giovannonii]|uniref:Neutral ceramidase n=1 Tax=Aquisphaera giovannonii TaxID=406548 RepID=A0A5B9VV47_9BACT|nr:hypothetical protein [Aquisphaera giovannonii]QEH32158.1 Neutral ceramidase precursor [Aquisphaera giovannonii]